MKVVYKYALQPGGRQQRVGSNPGRVVHVGVQHGSPCVWVEHDLTKHGDVQLDVVVTGLMFDPAGAVHVGSFLLDDGAFVGHVYQVSA